MSIGLSGNGYMFPLTLRDLVFRAESHPKLIALRELCRRTWPVDDRPVREPLWWRLPGRKRRHAQDMQGGRPSRRVVRMRREMGELWPYDSPDLPFDWTWGIGETG